MSRKNTPIVPGEQPDRDPVTASGKLIQAPAVPVKRSVFLTHIVCLDDGKKRKTLKRHLQGTYGMTPEAYRAKWDRPTS